MIKISSIDRISIGLCTYLSIYLFSIFVSEPYCRILVHIGSELVHKKKTCIAEAINRSPVWEVRF